jgi:hypothetical protein
MPKDFTERGFAIYKEIPTSYGGNIRIQESSNVIPSVWLFIEESVHCKSFDQHLNVAQAKELRDALNEFLGEYGD